MTIDQSRTELLSIILELEALETEVRNSYNGIGQDRCANCIREVARYYRGTVLNRLNNLDQARVTRIRNGEE